MLSKYFYHDEYTGTFHYFVLASHGSICSPSPRTTRITNYTLTHFLLIYIFGVLGEIKVELADLIVKAEQANPEDNSNKSKKNKKKEKTKNAEKTVEEVKEESVPAPENAKKKKNKNKNGTVGTEKISETVPEELKDVKLTEETPKSKKNKKKEEKKPEVKEDPKPAETSDTKESSNRIYYSKYRYIINT